jgi:hypothetical protein
VSGSVKESDFQTGNERYDAEVKGLQQQLNSLAQAEVDADQWARFCELVLMDFARICEQAEPDERGRVQNLLFSDGLLYDSNTKSLNPAKPCVFNALQYFCVPEEDLVAPQGFEPR